MVNLLAACSGDESLGWWHDKWVTLCVQYVYMYLPLNLFLLFFGLLRIWRVVRRDMARTIISTISGRFKFKLILCLFLAVLQIVRMGLKSRSDDDYLYIILTESSIVLSFLFTFIIMIIEHKSGCRQNFTLQVFWIWSLLVWAITFKWFAHNFGYIDNGPFKSSSSSLSSTSSSSSSSSSIFQLSTSSSSDGPLQLNVADFVLFIIQFVLVVLQCFLILFFNNRVVVRLVGPESMYIVNQRRMKEQQKLIRRQKSIIKQSKSNIKKSEKEAKSATKVRAAKKELRGTEREPLMAQTSDRHSVALQKGLGSLQYPDIIHQQRQHYSHQPDEDVDRWSKVDYDEVDTELGVRRQSDAHFLSKATFAWIKGVLREGFSKSLQLHDIKNLNRVDRCRERIPPFKNAWRSEKASAQLDQNNPRTPSLFGALFHLHYRQFLLAAFFKFLNDIQQFVGPLVLNILLVSIETRPQNAPDTHGIVTGLIWSLGLFLVYTFQSLCITQYNFRMLRMGMNVKSVLVSSIFEKTFFIDGEAKKKYNNGAINNLQILDSQKVSLCLSNVHMIWSAPFQLVVAFAGLFYLVQYAAIAGVVVMILIVPINILIMRGQTALYGRVMQAKDRRIQLTVEMFSNMRIIKMNAWERVFGPRVQAARSTEVQALMANAALKALSQYMWVLSPSMIVFITFITHVLVLGHRLDASTAFTVVALFGLMRTPLTAAPQALTALAEARTSLKRIQDFLLTTEMDHRSVTKVSPSPHEPSAILINKGTFTWGQKQQPVSSSSSSSSSSSQTPQAQPPSPSTHTTIDIARSPASSSSSSSTSSSSSSNVLTDINLRVERGELVIVVGAVGAGKSSLISAILGEMTKLSGDVIVSGRVAYVSQQSWIQNATVRENILFGEDFNEVKYNRIVNACQLLSDFQQLPQGDLTEIGERGVNVSGGQKQRIALARAVYQGADVYLLDDPLSAVDASVGHLLFEYCIQGEIKNATRILVTHSLPLLTYANRVLFMRSGSISEDRHDVDDWMRSFSKNNNDGDGPGSMPTSPVGSPMSTSLSSLPSNINKPTQNNKKPPTTNSTSTSVTPAKPKGPPASFIVPEARVEGKIDWSVYKHFVRAIKGSYFGAVLLLLLYVIVQAGYVTTGLWITYWVDNPYVVSPDRGIFTYGIIVSVVCVALLIRVFSLQFQGLYAAVGIHARMLGSVMHSPIAFFDSNPLGRIINRFTQDLIMVDEYVAFTLGSFLELCLLVLGVVFVNMLVSPFSLVPMLPLAGLYRFVQRYYLRTSREMKRIEVMTKSPISALFLESLNGMPIIRAHTAQQLFSYKVKRLVDDNARAYFNGLCVDQWLAIRIQFIGNCAVLIACMFTVLSAGTIEPGLAGIALSYALSLTSTLNFLVLVATQVENQAVSVERVYEYGRLSSEISQLANRPLARTIVASSAGASSGSPQNPGAVLSIRNIMMRYRPDLPIVLSDISFTTRPSEKIGIVGRTGSGKSSLISALFRLSECESGQIFLDGEDVRRLPLDQLRRRVSIVPQDPALFKGSLRFNLDPQGTYSDDSLWRALGDVGLHSIVRDLFGTLDSNQPDVQTSLSVGQRQLLCLARVILEPTTMLVMDEATSSVDAETDAMITKAVATLFKNRTVLTIAHRIRSILDSDRVLVMDAGRIVEFDAPNKLLSDPNTIFYKLYSSSSND
eukprot:TRINITY_DN2274_c2_g1_i3.p1 TRINITY_DN2274_c2_g1~~TRINITY_DN2274_c2_g1_i3.p1  ORF type:complete len:1681 (-),score=300.18 TRINITY_DN2274_c2_g1_i3:61-5103(-)